MNSNILLDNIILNLLDWANVKMIKEPTTEGSAAKPGKTVLLLNSKYGKILVTNICNFSFKIYAYLYL